MSLERHWFLNGQNYSRTLETWLQRQDRHRKQIMPIMEVMIWRAALGTNIAMVLLSQSIAAAESWCLACLLQQLSLVLQWCFMS